MQKVLQVNGMVLKTMDKYMGKKTEELTGPEPVPLGHLRPDLHLPIPDRRRTLEFTGHGGWDDPVLAGVMVTAMVIAVRARAIRLCGTESTSVMEVGWHQSSPSSDLC